MKPRWLKPRSRVCRPAQVWIIICRSSFKSARIWVQIGLLFSLCWVYGLFILWTWIFSMCGFVVLCPSWNTTRKGNPIFCDPICIGLFRDVLSNVFTWSLEFLVCLFYVQVVSAHLCFPQEHGVHVHGFAASHVSKLLIFFRLQDKNTKPDPPFTHKIWWERPKLLMFQFPSQNYQDKILLKFPK
jgi:hypothetical protein